MAARRKAKKAKKPKKAKKRARAATARKRSTASRSRARKASRPPAPSPALSKRVAELEAENRRLREENATLRAQLSEIPTPSADPETEPLPLE